MSTDGATMKINYIRYVQCGLAFSLLTLAACSGVPSKTQLAKVEQTETKQQVPRGKEVKVGGDGFALGDIEQPGCSLQQFVDRVDELLRGQCPAEAERWIRRYPDVALAVLREPTSVRAGNDVLAAIAAAHDRQCGVKQSAGWAAVFADRAANPQRYKPYDDKRGQFMVHLQNGRVKESLQLGLIEAAPTTPAPVVALDAWRLMGIALVLDARPRDAVGAFQKALDLAGRDHAYEAVNVLLLASDAQRRAEDALSADRTWQDAARQAALLIGQSTPLTDPILWERTAYLRPAKTPWPGEACRAWREANVAFGIVTDARSSAAVASTDEAPLWTAVGHWRLARDEAQAALVALKRAETLTPQPYPAARLQISQTKALVRLGQQPAAAAVLTQLAGHNDPLIAHAAMAMLGTTKLQQGSVQQGFNLLHKAVEDGAGSLVWPERTQAEADLGLAYLLIGDEAAGIRWLHQAQQAFESTGQHEALIQSLENEASFLDHAKKSDLAKAVRHRIETLRGA